MPSFKTPKAPADPTEVKTIVDRLRRVQESFGPKGLPKNPQNVTETNADFPLERTQPKDKGWDHTKMITGSGGGPELHNVGMLM